MANARLVPASARKAPLRGRSGVITKPDLPRGGFQRRSQHFLDHWEQVEQRGRIELAAGPGGRGGSVRQATCPSGVRARTPARTPRAVHRRTSPLANASTRSDTPRAAAASGWALSIKKS